jgi:RNA polymerase primary sigma factor
MKPEKKEKQDSFDQEKVVSLYFDEMERQYLTREQEVELSRRIRQGRVRKQEDREAVNQLCESCLPLVASIAKKYKGSNGAEFMDLVQEGNLGLMRAAEKFDHRFGCRFGTYATYWVRRFMRNYINGKAKTIHVPVNMERDRRRMGWKTNPFRNVHGREPAAEELAEIMDMPVKHVKQCLASDSHPVPLVSRDESMAGRGLTEDRLPDSEAPKPDWNIALEQIQTQLKASGVFSERDLDILRRRYYLEERLEQIGRRYRISRERVRQIEKKLIKAMRRIAKNFPLKP